MSAMPTTVARAVYLKCGSCQVFDLEQADDGYFPTVVSLTPSFQINCKYVLSDMERQPVRTISGLRPCALSGVYYGDMLDNDAQPGLMIVRCSMNLTTGDQKIFVEYFPAWMPSPKERLSFIQARIKKLKGV